MGWRAPGTPLSKPKTCCFPGPVYLRGWAQATQLFLLLTGSSVDQPRGSSGGSFWHSRPTRGNTQLVKTGALPVGRTQPSPWPAMGGGSCQPYARLGPEEASLCPAGRRQGGPPLQVAGGDEGVGPPHSAQVDHRAVVGHLN